MARVKTWLIFCTIFFLCSCAAKEDAPMKPAAESAPVTAPVVHGSIAATIDGTAWQTNSAAPKDMDEAIATLDPKTGLVTIRGTSSASDSVKVLEITLKSMQPGTYTLGPDFDH